MSPVSAQCHAVEHVLENQANSILSVKLQELVNVSETFFVSLSTVNICISNFKFISKGSKGSSRNSFCIINCTAYSVKMKV